MHIETRFDQKRGCGWRSPGGTYLVAQGVSAPCGMLPIPLTKCPTCSCGIKPSRGWTWLDIKALAAGKACSSPASECGYCPLSLAKMGDRQGLLWIGGSFYKRPEDWTNEAVKQGISRRLSAVPRDFELGKTWVLVAHREALTAPCPDCAFGPCETCGDTRTVPQAAIFHAFKPTAIEYVVKGDETEEELERLIKRGITPVKVVRTGEDQTALEDDDEDETVLEYAEAGGSQFGLKF